MAGRASFQDHVGVLEIGTVINASTVLQEEAILTTRTFSVLRTVAACTIRMALDAHVEVTGTRYSLCGFEITILSIALNHWIIAVVDAVSRRIENLACVASQASEVRGSVAFLARREASVAGIKSGVVVHATLASAVAILLVVVDYR